MRSLVLLLALAAVASAKSYSGYRVLRVDVEDEAQAKFLTGVKATGKFDFWNEVPRQGRVDIMVAPGDFSLDRQLKLKGLRHSVLMSDVQSAIDRQMRDLSRQDDMTWTEYHTLDTVYAWMDGLAAAHDHVSVENIGESFEGREMKLIKICSGGCGGKPAIWIDAGAHPREWITQATATYVINELTDNLAAGNQELVDNLDWYILPFINPDGYEYTMNQETGDRLWKKTRSLYPGDTCVGTDQNRNWGYIWGGEGSSNSSCSESYRGPEAWSEVENVHVRDFILAQDGAVKYYTCFHSFQQHVVGPWAHTQDRNPDYDAQMTFGQKAKDAMEAVNGLEYSLGAISDILYLSTGNAVDWAYGEGGAKYAFNMELRDKGEYGYLLPAAQIVDQGREVFAFFEVTARDIIAEFGAK